MKIAISTDLYYPMINGVAVFSRNLAAGLSQRGHEVIVLAPSITGEPSIEKDPEYNFKVARLSSVKLPFYPDQINKIPEMKAIFGKKIPRLFYKNGLHVSFNPYFEIKTVLDQFQPDLIHDQTPGPVALAVFRYADKRDIPLVSTGHAYPDNFTSQLKLPKTIKKPVDAVVRSYFASFLKKSAHATAPTEIAVHDLVPNRQKLHTPVEALSNGIDLSRFSAGQPKSSIYAKYKLPKTPFALYVGRIDPEKSLHVLIESFAKTLNQLPAAKLVIVGDGSDKQHLEDLSRELEISKSVIFTGKIIGNDLPEVYRAARLFAITSTTETQSIVLMEALASGLPAVAVRAGAIPELVKNNQNGFLCKPSDTSALARGIAKLLSDDRLQKKMSAASLKIISTHNIDYTLNRMEQIYTKVISKTA
ncbi:glycosyltransferase [Candidatus Saccharibacteria bacterium]|nr:glycosyltransferase [Candidatus Saccharibacteria bacterium]